MDVEKQIAEVLREHRLGIREWSDGYRYTSCMCPQEVNAAAHDAHVAKAIVLALGLHQEWSIVHTHGRNTSRGVYAREPVGWRDSNERIEHRLVSYWATSGEIDQ